MNVTGLATCKNTGLCEDTSPWKYLWCQGGGVVPCQILSWYWRRSGHTAQRKPVSPRIRDLPLSIAGSHADRCLGMFRAHLFNSSVSLGFWVTLCVLWLVHWLLYNRVLISTPATSPELVVPKFKVASWSISGEAYLPAWPGEKKKKAFFILLISLDIEMESRSVLRHRCQKCSAPKISKYLTALLH